MGEANVLLTTDEIRDILAGLANLSDYDAGDILYDKLDAALKSASRNEK